MFRRINPSISNEQIWHAYDISLPKAKEMQEQLKADLSIIYGRSASNQEATFRTVVLLDDFTASGRSYIRTDCAGVWHGKLPRILKMLNDNDGVGSALAKDKVGIMVVMYIASSQAVDHINEYLRRYNFTKGLIGLHVVHVLARDTPLQDERDSDILRLARCRDYFDASADDKHGKKQLGYANCRLPVVLNHNTPNNSIFILWGEDHHTFRGLFPRVSRHREVG